MNNASIYNNFVPIQWPDIQNLMGRDGFEENCFPITDPTGREIFGECAYFCNTAWLPD